MFHLMFFPQKRAFVNIKGLKGEAIAFLALRTTKKSNKF